jgi:hypothetical protein
MSPGRKALHRHFAFPRRLVYVVHGRSSDSAGSTLLAPLPGDFLQCLMGVRTCLPLRGSSGIAPDSLLILVKRNHELFLKLSLPAWRKQASAAPCVSPHQQMFEPSMRDAACPRPISSNAYRVASIQFTVVSCCKLNPLQRIFWPIQGGNPCIERGYTPSLLFCS